MSSALFQWMRMNAIYPHQAPDNLDQILTSLSNLNPRKVTILTDFNDFLMKIAYILTMFSILTPRKWQFRPIFVENWPDFDHFCRFPHFSVYENERETYLVQTELFI